jgi:hypothetical protein
VRSRASLSPQEVVAIYRDGATCLRLLRDRVECEQDRAAIEAGQLALATALAELQAARFDLELARGSK